MKKFEFIIALLLTLAIVLSSFQSRDRDNKIKDALETINENQATLQREIQTIQDNYVSYDDIQPVIEMFDEYQLEVDQIRGNINDWNGMWKQFFDYEQEQYMMRGR